MNFDNNLVILIASIVVAAFTILSLCISIFKTLFNRSERQKNKALEAQLDVEQAERVEAEAQATQSKSTCNQLKGIVDIVKNVVPLAVEIAEESGVATGEAKMLIALSKVSLWCAENGFDFSMMKDDIVGEIERLISFSKKVNYKKEEKPNGEVHGNI